MDTYCPEDEELMQRFYTSLSEKDRRRYAAIEAQKLGHGGQLYIASVLDCDPKTIRVGLRELESLPEGIPPRGSGDGISHSKTWGWTQTL